MAQPTSRPDAPRRLLTDWTTSAGLDGAGLLALVLGGATAEGIHLATLGYEVFVLHADEAAAEAAQQTAHVHHVAADHTGLPDQWRRRFDLVVAIDVPPAVEQVADAGLLLVVGPTVPPAPRGLEEVLREAAVGAGDDARVRAVWARLTSPAAS
jgi:D-arabinose 1-dehydrogenase-like Zn-dependent alcohol dehydrogenase